jgi:hypothetical protein
MKTLIVAVITVIIAKSLLPYITTQRDKTGTKILNFFQIFQIFLNLLKSHYSSATLSAIRITSS